MVSRGRGRLDADFFLPLSQSRDDPRAQLAHVGLIRDVGPIARSCHSHLQVRKIADNWSAGIQHEISYDATIRHNEISENGRRQRGWRGMPVSRSTRPAGPN